MYDYDTEELSDYSFENYGKILDPNHIRYQLFKLPVPPKNAKNSAKEETTLKENHETSQKSSTSSETSVRAYDPPITFIKKFKYSPASKESSIREPIDHCNTAVLAAHEFMINTIEALPHGGTDLFAPSLKEKEFNAYKLFRMIDTSLPTSHIYDQKGILPNTFIPAACIVMNTAATAGSGYWDVQATTFQDLQMRYDFNTQCPGIVLKHNIKDTPEIKILQKDIERDSTLPLTRQHMEIFLDQSKEYSYSARTSGSEYQICAALKNLGFKSQTPYWQVDAGITNGGDDFKGEISYYRMRICRDAVVTTGSGFYRVDEPWPLAGFIEAKAKPSFVDLVIIRPKVLVNDLVDNLFDGLLKSCDGGAFPWYRQLLGDRDAMDKESTWCDLMRKL